MILVIIVFKSIISTVPSPLFACVQVTVTVEPGVQPPPHRYFHSACYVPSKRSMYIYGGFSETSYLSDLWTFSVDSEGWTLLDGPVTLAPSSGSNTNGKNRNSGDNTRVFSGVEEEKSSQRFEFLLPPPVAGHTLSYCKIRDRELLLLIGGVSDVEGFLNVIWEYDVSTGLWSVLKTTGTVPLGLFGHSTVYHSDDNVLYVYGGYSYQVDQVGLFGGLYAFHYPSRVWSLLPPDTKINQNSASRPAPRAFHTAVINNDYMLVIGGYIEEQRDLKQTLIAYSFKCNMWVPLNENFISLAGPELEPQLGLASAIHSGIVYVFGGFDGETHGKMMSISLADDLCVLNENKTQCRDRIGCANCVVYRRANYNSSYCYSNSRNTSKPDVCYGASGGEHPGKVCDASILQRDCYQYNSCATCLATYPAVSGSKQKCKWCNNCLKGKCIPRENNCSTEVLCDRNRNKTGTVNETDILNADDCLEKSCAATDCFKCGKLMQCIWTRQVLRSPDFVFNLSVTPIYNWNCVETRILNHSSYLVESSPPATCPIRCQYHRSCKSCLDSGGGEGGWQGCYWSPSLKTCMAPSYVPLRCLGGRCGMLLQELPCPQSCSSYTNCSACLQQLRCGWCGLVTAVGGLGVCTDGDLAGPRSITCDKIDYSYLLSNASVANLHGLASSDAPWNVSWSYLKCPPEDECRSGHHTCHPTTEVCVDVEQGFKCVCAEGYNTRFDGECIPLCSQGCVYGTCVQPNHCSCNFGFVGTNCSIKCQCNGHSDCKGPDKLAECIKCHNNTRGSHCDKCDRFYVGNPINNGTCVSCHNYCNTHSSECYPRDYDGKLAYSSMVQREEETGEFQVFTDAICSSCQNNTSGYMCETCLPGFFRGSTDLRKPCKHCECNGHSNECDKVWGDNCKCFNNTVSPCTAKTNRGFTGKDEDKDCQKKQCTKCKESYLGNPSHGHQCYYQMTVEKEYCLDPDTQSKCDSTPRTLEVGQTVYFGVQPKFMNVNIRLVLDITKGGVKVYFSSEEDAFLVNVDKTTWHHTVKIDSKYPLKQEHHPFYGTRALNRNYIGNGLGVHDIISVASSLTKSMPNPPIISTINETKFSGSKLRLIERKAYGLKTFITVEDPTDILIVHNVTNRLVITLPQNGHDLRSAKFYLIIEGKSEDMEGSLGSVFFRQDQPRIDLFVFFSVFFSCFFLFLAVCVVVWKIKQGVDMRRARLRHVVEMLHMAKRPFAVTTLILQVRASLI